ncbi:FAD-dependent oxidoreductase [Candidatus Woesearchaeota archaeon]|nr:FAD-dependent oxidoreductase [Candidatus Woesearchaeota archaeon]
MYDVAILGAGPAGLTAAIYCARYKLKTLLLSKDVGGYVGHAVEIGNFPGYTAVKGSELAQRYREQIKANEIDYKRETVADIRLTDTVAIKTNKGEYNARYLVYALGTDKRRLGVPGEGLNGIYFCATCDAPFMEGKEVVVVGGNDSGTTAALLISEYAAKVTIVEIMDRLLSEPVWVEKVNKNPKIDVLLSESVKEIKGSSKVSSIVLNSGKEIPAEGVFIEIGSVPATAIAKKVGVRLDEHGYIDVDSSQKTSVSNVYAAGDVTNNSNYLRQIVAAQGEGAVAAQAIYKRILNEESR